MPASVNGDTTVVSDPAKPTTPAPVQQVVIDPYVRERKRERVSWPGYDKVKNRSGGELAHRKWRKTRGRKR